MSAWTKTACFGAVLGLTGAFFFLSPWGVDLEEAIGLDLLFHLRGAQRPPPDIVMVAIDQASADHFGVPLDPRGWPRSIHARLTQHLKELNPSVIVFDLLFTEETNPEDDRLLSESLREAGNVILADMLINEIIPLRETDGSLVGSLNIERIVPPAAMLRNSCLATASFPLPKQPGRVSSFWAFKPEVGDVPTLPVLAYQTFALQKNVHVRQLMASLGIALPGEKGPEKGQHDLLKEAAQSIRQRLLTDPGVRSDSAILTRATPGRHFEPDRHLKAFISAYSGPSLRYLNFYGQPGSFPTYPYFALVEENWRALGDRIRDKAVFIGLMDIQRPSLKDTYYSVFSRPDGIDMSGVEIAATAFANLLEDTWLRQLPGHLQVLVVSLWGFILAGIAMRFPASVAWAAAIAGSLAYAALAYKIFSDRALWLPLVVPVFLQTPVALVGVLTLRYIEANRERKNIRTAFGYYLPDAEVDRLARKVKDIGASRQVVYATCLVTDAENYTGLSEQMNPEELSRFVNSYFEVMFEPVRRNSGIISDVKGDSMLALWPAFDPQVDLRARACQAAMEIQSAVDRFNRGQADFRLPTRIGMHSGYIALGNVGAVHHYEYRPVGDIVNTASKLEHLNKRLGTKTLVSGSVREQLDGFWLRNLGDFLLPGKSMAITAWELITQADAANESHQQIGRKFAAALQAFHRRAWMEAASLFRDVLRIDPNDGPSEFYITLCETYRARPPGSAWDGAIQVKDRLTPG